MEREEYNFFESIIEKPDCWKVDGEGELTATFTYNGMGQKRIPGTTMEVQFPTKKDVSFTRKQLQNIHRELYTRIQDIETELLELEMGQEASQEASMNWAALFGIRIKSDEEVILQEELQLAQNAERIVTDTLGLNETALEA